ncbi:Spo0B C-terminal domain-containing protein [Halalkalibacter suaedae]|uniref:Spo0B domain-containing protein n=1 Tax=Halalkalibacter suaedae TaxID=2822140 RepID=A0A940WVV0_9BACI|nr:Spo0B C-terminal domain-containing protein [Bacillus suaedae]MBP3951427.1 Spo0B domain-containing protein [Bacillus suaedae]
MTQSDILKALRQTRHDWLNVIQLIKGNLALNRYDRIEEIIEQVTQQSFSESKLSAIEATSVEYFLLTYNWANHPTKLDMDLAGDVFSLFKEEERLLRLCRAVTEKLNDACTKDAENNLLLSFLFKKDVCELTFDFQGSLNMSLEDWSEVVTDDGLAAKLEELSEHECVITASFIRS